MKYNFIYKNLNFENEDIITVNITLLIYFNECDNGILFEEMSNSIMSKFCETG